jgi:carboxymethylenebutenolidase
MTAMKRQDLRIRSAEGPEFDCYLVTPDTQRKVPAIVLASAIHGVDKDLRSIADEFASHGYLAAAPDLFWRTTPGPLTRDDPRSAPRGQPRLEKIKTGEQDLKDVLPLLRKQPPFNGKAAVIGFCYGGPYAVLGPKRLGYDAGISCHGTQMLDYAGELEGVRQPVCVIWGDRDHLAPPPVLDAYRGLAQRMKNLELHVFPGVEHGYMMKDAKAYDATSCEFSMQRALAILKGLESR